MEIQYTVTGVSKNFNPPAMVPGQPAPAPSYNVTLQLTTSPQFMGMSQITIQVDAVELTKYAMDAVGSITINDPVAPHSVPSAPQAPAPKPVA